MNITKYAPYFHDGYVDKIVHNDNDIDFYLESSVIHPEDIDDKSILSDEGTIKGILTISNIKKIVIENQKYHEKLTKTYDDGEILDFKLDGHNFFLLVEWYNFPPKSNETHVSKIEIEAETIYWLSRN